MSRRRRPRRSRRRARPLPGSRAPGRCRRATLRRAARSPPASNPASRTRRRRQRRRRGRGRVPRPSSRTIRRPRRTPAPGSPAGSPSVQRQHAPGRAGRQRDGTGVVGVHDHPIARRLERDDARLRVEVGREAAVLVDVVGPDVRDAGDVRTGGADGEVIRRELGHAQRRRARGEHTLEQFGGRPGVVGRRVARAQRLDRRSRAASPRPGAPWSSCRRFPSRPAPARARSAGAGRRRRRRRPGRAARRRRSGVQGESSRTSSPTPSERAMHAQRGELGLLAGRHRRAHAGGPESSSRSSTSGRRRIAATGRPSSRW